MMELKSLKCETTGYLNSPGRGKKSSRELKMGENEVGSPRHFNKDRITKFNLQDLKTHPNCTYYQYGKTNIEQVVKYCEVCDPNHGEPMCEDCLFNCHATCGKNLVQDVEEEEEKKEQEMTVFSCECGKKKHRTESKGDMAMSTDKKCCLLDLDIKIRNKMYYSCPNCNVSVLCFICYSYCHVGSKCKSSRKKKDKLENANKNELSLAQIYESPNKGKRCECNHQSHSSIITINTYLNYLLTNNKFVYDTLPFVWKIQLLNCIFDSEIPQKLFFPVDYFFSNFPAENQDKKIDDLFKTILVRLTNDIKTDLTLIYYNYHPKIITMFPYEKLVNLLYKFKEKDLMEQSDLIQSILHILLYVHYKKDFQNMKNLCVFDFMVENTLERLNWRRFLHTESIYTQNLHEKYFNKSKNKFNLPEITNFIAGMLEKAIRAYKKQGLSKCMDSYFICFRIIFFNLKRMTYDMQSLVELINILEKIAEQLHLKIRDIVSRYRDMKIKNDHTYNWWIVKKGLFRIMTLVTKITYLATINYNDLVSMEMLSDKFNFKKSNLNFIQGNSEPTNKLFKILVSTSMYYSTFILNNEIFKKENVESNSNPTPGLKYLNIFNETLELFTVTDNLYFQQLDDSTAEELYQYLNLSNRISQLRSMETNNNLRVRNSTLEIENGFGENDTFTFCELNCEQSGRFFDMLAKKAVFDLKQKIEGIIDLFFSYKISLTQLNNLATVYITEFGKLTLGMEFSSVIQKLPIGTSKVNDKKINNYRKKLLKLLKENFKFLSEEFIENEEKLNALTCELMFSNVDITLTKLFMVDFKQLNYSQETTNSIFECLSLHCLTREGVKYFCIGRNLRRIIKIFEVFPKRTLEFLCLLFKGVYIYDIDVSYHKRLHEVMNMVKNYIQNYNVHNETQEKEFKEFLTDTIKLLHSLSKNFTVEEMMIIRKQIFNYVDNKKLLNKEKIVNSFPVGYGKLDRRATGVFGMIPEGEGIDDPYFDEREFNLDYVREIYERENRQNKHKMPLNKDKSAGSKRLLRLKEENEKQGESFISGDMVSLIKKDSHSNANSNQNSEKKRDPNSDLTDDEDDTKNLQGTEKKFRVNYSHSILNFDYTLYSENKLMEPKRKRTNVFNKIEKDHKFFFSFIKLIADFTHYFLNDDNIFQVINSFNDLQFYMHLLNKNYLSLKNRTSLLIYLRSIYFTDMLSGKDLSKEEKYIKSDKYPKYLKMFKEIVEESQHPFGASATSKSKKKQFVDKGYAAKMQNLNYMENAMEIFIQELQNFNLFIYLEQDQIDVIEKYLLELLYTVKIIADTFVTDNIPSHMTLLFYELTKEFLKKTSTFSNYINYIRANGKVDDIDTLEVPSNSVFLMETYDFDVYDTEIIYSLLLKEFNDIFKETNINKDFRIESFIKQYVDGKDRNFRVFCLSDKENLYSDFLEKEKENALAKSESNLYSNPAFDSLMQKFKLMKEEYLRQFLDIYNTTFITELFENTNDTEVDNCDIFFDFSISYIYHLDKVSFDNVSSILVTLNKLLLHHTEDSQDHIKTFLEKNSLEEMFFMKYNQKLQEMLNINIVTSKSFLISERYIDINLTTKVMIQFIQLLGEKHNKDFQTRIITSKDFSEIVERNEKKSLADKAGTMLAIKGTVLDPYVKNLGLFGVKMFNEQIAKIDDKQKEEPSNSIFSVLTKVLRSCVDNLEINNNFQLDYEMPYDKLIVLIGNIIDCMIEFFQGSSKLHLSFMYGIVRPALPSFKRIMFISEKSDENFNSEHTKTITNSMINQSQEFFCKPRKKVFLAIKIYIINLITSIIQEGTAPVDMRNEIVNYFPPVELFEIIVSNVREIILIFKINKKLPEKFDIDDHRMVYKNTEKLKELYIYEQSFENLLQLKLALKIFYYLKFLAEVYNNQIARKILQDFEGEYKEEESDDNDVQIAKETNKIKKCYGNYVIYNFLNQLLKKIEIRFDNNEGNKDVTYFVIPPICFLLSNQTMNSFTNNVERESTHTKINTLISETDYFIYEMFYNNRMMRSVSNSSTTKILYNINLYNCEIINYLIIVIQNLILLVYFYETPKENFILFTNEEKYSLQTANLVLSIIQLCFLGFLLAIWMKYKFFLNFQHNLMKFYNKRFIIKSKQKDHTISLNNTIDSLIDNFNTNLRFFTKLKVALVDSILLNREINIFAYTVIFLIIFLTTKSAIFIVIPILFVVNLSSILFGIIQAVQLRWVQMMAVLIYTYLLVYFYSWIAFYFYYESYTFSDILHVSDNTVVTENLCTSPLQCYLMNLDYGVRAGGGIGDVLSKVSFRHNSGYWIARFFYDIIFHITVIWVMTNLFFGIIVDTFADLRDKNNLIENDKKNVCFICQMDRDKAMNCNIDFDDHVTNDHYLWNYVYFLTYLHINNPNDFKFLETYVWEKLHSKDNSWIPIFKDMDEKVEEI